jgi:hypothetical protein
MVRALAREREREREREKRIQQVQAVLRSVIPYFLGWL